MDRDRGSDRGRVNWKAIRVKKPEASGKNVP